VGNVTEYIVKEEIIVLTAENHNIRPHGHHWINYELYKSVSIRINFRRKTLSGISDRLYHVRNRLLICANINHERT
jgi:hypothetical protein